MSAEPGSDRATRRALAWLLALAVLSGLAIAWLDSQEGWDDTGISAGLLLLTCGIFTAVRPAYPWLWALAIGCWIPIVGITSSQDYGSLVALAVAFLGAYTASLAVRTIRLFR